MSKRLFVGGLPYRITSQELKEMFAKYGKIVSANVISDKYTGRSKGFGFVEMEVDTDADKAIEALNQTDLEGRKIAVNVAKPMEPREPRRDFQRRDFRSGDRRQRDGRGAGRGGGFRGGGRY